MCAALIDGASLTPSPVIATTLALLLERVDEQHLVLGGDAADDADRVDPLEALGLVERGELGAEDRLALDPELLGDRRAGDHVVAGDHPHADVRLLGVGHRLLGLGARRVDHPDEARDLEAVDVAEQVAVGVERRRVEVAEARGHHAQPVLPHPLDVGLAPGAQLRRPRGCSRRRTARSRRGS